MYIGRSIKRRIRFLLNVKVVLKNKENEFQFLSRLSCSPLTPGQCA